MKIVSVITDPVVVDSILRHVEEGGDTDPHNLRGADPEQSQATRADPIPYPLVSVIT